MEDKVQQSACTQSGTSVVDSPRSLSKAVIITNQNLMNGTIPPGNRECNKEIPPKHILRYPHMLDIILKGRSEHPFRKNRARIHEEWSKCHTVKVSDDRYNNLGRKVFYVARNIEISLWKFGAPWQLQGTIAKSLG
ncbi:Hypothetical predicted protein [Pelobates cultripes]|uniref:Uncharacterized protein n=1 Tax=Pelobates cultripes TaxID=61616 RepID=A0AAD1SV03_PELCU|nr:Hypothetical predicted protein [Pelobates cultripes]